MRPDFGDFRAAFFDLAFSFTPSHGNGAEADSYARSKTKNCRSRIRRFRSRIIVFVPGTKAILCEIEKSAGF